MNNEIILAAAIAFLPAVPLLIIIHDILAVTSFSQCEEISYRGIIFEI